MLAVQRQIRRAGIGFQAHGREHVRAAQAIGQQPGSLTRALRIGVAHQEQQFSAERIGVALLRSRGLICGARQQGHDVGVDAQHRGHTQRIEQDQRRHGRGPQPEPQVNPAGLRAQSVGARRV